MNIEEFRTYCLNKPGVSEGFPFDESTLVFKVMGKMFALTSLERPYFSVNLKCDPEKALQLRDQYESISGGYHMSKKHWNTISFEKSEISKELLCELTDHSYELVVSKLTKKLKEELEKLKK